MPSCGHKSGPGTTGTRPPTFLANTTPSTKRRITTKRWRGFCRPDRNGRPNMRHREPFATMTGTSSASTSSLIPSPVIRKHWSKCSKQPMYRAATNSSKAWIRHLPRTIWSMTGLQKCYRQRGRHVGLWPARFLYPSRAHFGIACHGVHFPYPVRAMKSLAPIRSSTRLALSLGGLFLLIVLWAMGAHLLKQSISVAHLLTPKETFESLYELVVQNQLTRHTLVSLKRVAVGLFWALEIGRAHV